MQVGKLLYLFHPKKLTRVQIFTHTVQNTLAYCGEPGSIILMIYAYVLHRRIKKMKK